MSTHLFTIPMYFGSLSRCGTTMAVIYSTKQPGQDQDADQDMTHFLADLSDVLIMLDCHLSLCPGIKWTLVVIIWKI